ncbi:Ubiquitin-like modifier-activating enzyme 6 [Balamuthia mandrillaris]
MEVVLPASFEVPDEAKNIDIDLYSRQYYVYGGQAMSKMAESTIFLSGLGGLGVEIAKNIALAGVKTLTLHDSQPTTTFDLSSQFFLGEGDLGKNRVEASVEQIKELNPYTTIDIYSGDLDKADLSFFDRFKCVILTDTPLDLQLKINDYCHSKGIAFISADVRGLFCSAFCDFGEKFEIHDKNGEENLEVMIDGVTKANPGVVTCLEKAKHGFEDGDLVKFREVKGMTELNDRVFEVKVVNSFTFSIGDTSAFSDYKEGGLATQMKKPFQMSFLPLREALVKPELLFADWAKMHIPPSLHVGMQALDAFRKENEGKLPSPWNAEHAAKVVELAKAITSKSPATSDIDEEVVQKLAFTSQGGVAGLTAFLGGVTAQEAIKSVTGKFTPLNQFLYLDALELLPAREEGQSAEDYAAQFQPKGDRYDSLIVCIGKDLLQQLLQLKVFMVGAGAIGCEMFKNFAMHGIGAGGGQITVTDNDVIEKSNLNRQFLFRPKDIRQPKSTTAGNAAIRMNPGLQVDAHLNKVGPDTEATYSDAFFKSQDIVVNALDNIAARLYVDGRCVTNQRPLLESGTLSTKGHVQVIVPFMTESYGSRRDPPEKDVPFCTLKSFPNQIEHTIQWARDKFENLFSNKPKELDQLWEDPLYLEKLRSSTGNKLVVARRLLKILDNKPTSYDDCVSWARLKFEQNFTNKLIQLLHSFPLDMEMKDGTRFWSGAKRPPTVLKFDSKNSLHLDFIRYAAALYAKTWGIQPQHVDPRSEEDNDYLRKVCEATEIPIFKPKENKKIETDTSIKEAPKEEPPMEEFDEAAFKEALDRLAAYVSEKEKFKLRSEDFEKDDDSNFHIDFITACSNLRASNYQIQAADRLKTKRIAGRIMPAIATTTAAVSGLVAVELIKIVKGCKLEAYKNTFLNLALPMFQMAEPFPAEKTKIGPVEITLWDQWDVKLGDITLQEFCDHFKTKYNLEVTGVFQGVQMVYVPIMPGHEGRLPKKLKRYLTRERGQKYVDLIVTFEDESGGDVHGPPVRFWLVGKKRAVVKKASSSK